MDWTSRVRFACAVDGQPLDEDVALELAQHAAAAYERARAEGRTEAEAVRVVETLLAGWRRDAAALRRRHVRPPLLEPPATRSGPLAGLPLDVRYGVRVLTRERSFALVSILTIALGIGATTTLFSVVNGVLLKPLPWAESERLVRVSEMRQGHPPRVPG